MAGAASSSSTTASTSKNGKAKASEDAMEVDEEQIDRVKEHYFFPKFLTSRGLLELQVCLFLRSSLSVKCSCRQHRWPILTSDDRF